MAFAVRLIGYAKSNDSALVDIEPSWWDPHELMCDARFVQSNDTGSYFDYDADLSVAETRELHERFKPAASGRGDKYQEAVRPMIERLDALFTSDESGLSHFHVRVFQWESGLGC